MEWTRQYNSFNSSKGLAYYENYKQIIAWMNGAKYLPPPIEVNLDPFAECNLNCYFCIGQRYLKSHREEVGEMRILPTEYMLRLVSVLKGWGVKGLCISGGGEPTLHPGIPQTIHHASNRGLDVALVTNMVKYDYNLTEAMMRCRWVAMSIDAGNQKTYHKIKGKNYFGRVIENIEKAVMARKNTNSKVDLCYKMVVLPENFDTIHETCKLAKDLGVQDFHVRPVDLERSDIVNHRKLQFNMAKIQEQFVLCRAEETADFHVYTVTHKFDNQFHNQMKFQSCKATPLLMPILTNGRAYACVDKKMMVDWEIGNCYPEPLEILDWWGSDKHREFVKAINPPKQCSGARCTFQCYNEQIEKIVETDDMCLSFP